MSESIAEADPSTSASRWAERLSVYRLQVILKTVERCNLACPYCYYFFMGDETYKKRPARIARAVVERLASFLEQAITDLDIKCVEIVFHGGEPTLQKVEDFEWSCSYLRKRLGGSCQLAFLLQTNGTRLSERWLEAVDRHKVVLGVSIDGARDQHDSNRYYHNGKGSYDDIVGGLARVNARGGAVTLLSVLNAGNDYVQLVDHFADELGVRRLNFLLPDCTHDNGVPDAHSAVDYGQVLCDLFDVWERREDIDIREVTRFLRRFQKATLSPAGRALRDEWRDGNRRVLRNHVVVVHSNGEMSIDDSYMAMAKWRSAAPVANIETTSLKGYLGLPIFSEIYEAMETAPLACRECPWLAICGGGDLENRYSSDKGFDNPSVFCEGLKMFYEHGVRYLLRNGYPKGEIVRRLECDFADPDVGYAA